MSKQTPEKAADEAIRHGLTDIAVQRFIAVCRSRCELAIANTPTGKWLDAALRLLERQGEDKR